MARLIGLKDRGDGKLEYREQQIKHFASPRLMVLAMVDFLERKEEQTDLTTGRPVKLNREFLHLWLRIQLFEQGNSYFKKLEQRNTFDAETIGKAYELVKNYLTERSDIPKLPALQDMFPVKVKVQA
jgi:hypothetical protein